jgi:hypothetical protein
MKRAPQVLARILGEDIAPDSMPIMTTLLVRIAAWCHASAGSRTKRIAKTATRRDRVIAIGRTKKKKARMAHDALGRLRPADVARLVTLATRPHPVLRVDRVRVVPTMVAMSLRDLVILIVGGAIVLNLIAHGISALVLLLFSGDKE